MIQLETYEIRLHDATIRELKDVAQMQYMPNDRTSICCIFIDAEVVELSLDGGARLIEFETKIVPGGIPLEIVGGADNPKTGHRWYDRVKESVEYIGRNWGPIVFILDRLCGK